MNDMDRHIEDLQFIVSQVVAVYATRSLNAKLYYIHDEAQQTDSVVAVPNKRDIPSHIMLLTRIEGNRMIIEADSTDRPLDEALVAAGVDRSQIVLAYSGEVASPI